MAPQRPPPPEHRKQANPLPTKEMNRLMQRYDNLTLKVSEDKCPYSWDAELVYLWRKYSAGGIYQE